MQGSLNNCVAEGTAVKCKEGWKKVEEIRLGDVLWEGTVEGILHGKGSASVLIHSVKISAMHIVFDASSSRWVFAKDHSAAIPCDVPPCVYSLVTSSRTWSVRGDEELLLRDWTHSAEGSEEAIQRKVCSLLQTPFVGVRGLGLVGPNSMVKKEGHSVPLSSVRLGDKVWDGSECTEVTSTYVSIERGNASGPNSSAWSQGSAGWVQRPIVAEGDQVPLIHCGTASGRLEVNGEVIRDFNEIDKDQFTELEEFLLCLL
jgi:hypothetical protein